MILSEGNKIIARFMGGKYKPVKAGFERGSSYTSQDIEFDTQEECLRHCDELNEGKHPDECFFPLPDNGSKFKWQYDSDWNALMGVIEKIRQEHKKRDRTPNEITEWCHVTGLLICTPIEEVWKAVVKFLTWHSQHSN